MNKGFHDEAYSHTEDLLPGIDGVLDRVMKYGHKKRETPAIFVHAGAGFHSHQNEHVHLEACVAAAEMGMKFLKAGASATEAVEATLRILEDKEITNAGYGSNLSIDGTVECDATIVDHFGRSGACGAVPNIRNPISLAKLILDTSSQPLSLRRVPPNTLVGEGARLFAAEHGMSSVPNEQLVSKTSRDRFFRWQDDLRKAETKSKEGKQTHSTSNPATAYASCPSVAMSSPKPGAVFPRDHAAAVMAGTWNEGQADSPFSGTPSKESPNSQDACASLIPPRPPWVAAPSPTRQVPPPITSTVNIQAGTSGRKSSFGHTSLTKQVSYRDQVTNSTKNSNRRESERKLHRLKASSQTSRPNVDGSASVETPSRGRKRSVEAVGSPDTVGERVRQWKRKTKLEEAEDAITDTIGAIAIDENGHVAAGSSSGGIGMKHRGRLGPAALVGVGTAVVPPADGDETHSTVAAVTSGTGEHMATTMASQRCAERLYFGNRAGVGGQIEDDDDDDAIMESFITKDFMGHPGVKNCPSAGAIGVMAVKKARGGYYLYFAHNTDSFALASMGGLDKKPVCVMSRLSEGADICHGARKVRVE